MVSITLRVLSPPLRRRLLSDFRPLFWRQSRSARLTALETSRPAKLAHRPLWRGYGLSLNSRRNIRDELRQLVRIAGAFGVLRHAKHYSAVIEACENRQPGQISN